MNYKKLGHTGLRVSELCLGTMTFQWTTDEKSSLEVLTAFAEAGGTFIDTADIYSRWAPGNPGGTAETIIGKWLRDGRPRDKFVIATKGRGPMGDGPNEQGASRGHLVKAVEDSLRRLNTDYIDLYQIHWHDPDTPLEETLRALDDMVSAGKIRYIGTSNTPAWVLMKSLWVSDVRNFVRFETIQPHYNLMHRDEFERELMPMCQSEGLGVIPYSPLAGGFLSGKYRRGEGVPANTRGERNERIQSYMDSDAGMRVLDALEHIGAAHGKSIPQTALAWLMGNPVVTAPIVGANTAEQLKDALGAVDYHLSADEMQTLNEASA
ncbi:MAG TPA: aldo/keto reductase [Thermoflexales bacterium]|nr:aldo/keto reductase [Thermoflexales bacterium]HQZ21793.1 aldo/keto reductase [Thermoflexales bacterium]